MNLSDSMILSSPLESSPPFWTIGRGAQLRATNSQHNALPFTSPGTAAQVTWCCRAPFCPQLRLNSDLLDSLSLDQHLSPAVTDNDPWRSRQQVYRSFMNPHQPTSNVLTLKKPTVPKLSSSEGKHWRCFSNHLGVSHHHHHMLALTTIVGKQTLLFCCCLRRVGTSLSLIDPINQCHGASEALFWGLSIQRHQKKASNLTTDSCELSCGF